MCKKWGGKARTGMIWLRIGTGGGHLWIRKCTFVFHKMRGISRLDEELPASQEGLCSLESDSYEDLTTRQNINIICETSFTVPSTWTVKNTHRLKYSRVASFFKHSLSNSFAWQKKCRLCPHRRAERESCVFSSVTDYVQLQNCTPNRTITLLKNGHAEEVTIFVLAELNIFLHRSNRIYLCTDQGVLNVLE